MKIKEAIKNAVYVLRERNIEDANLKARILLAYILNKDKTYLIINDKEEIDFETQKKYFSTIDRLINGEPIQYITNSQDFMGYNFYVDNNVLIPQPDTEILVEEVLKSVNNKSKILDLCTGSGAIAISISKKSNIEVVASDISREALNIAEKNASNLDAKVIFIESDMFENIDEKFDIIVSNPPYIETNTIYDLPKEVQNEPHLALDGGKDGLDFYRIIAKQAKEYLLENGKLFLEIGYNQKESVHDILKNEKYKNIECIKDYAGNDRVIIAEK